MNFYYDPILGLQYTTTTLYLMDIEMLPEKLDIDNFLKECQKFQTCLGFISSTHSGVEPILNITQNYI